MSDFELPNLMQVRAFVRVADLGSVSRASEALFRAQSVVTRAIGLDGQDALEFRRHLTDSTFGAHAVSPEQAAHSRAEVDRIMNELIEDRRANGGDDVITGLLENELKVPGGENRKLTNEEIFSYCKLIIFAGGGTTWRQLGITIEALLTHYHFWEECREDRSLIEQASRKEILMMVPVVFLVLPVTVVFAFWPGFIGLTLTS